MDSTDPAFAAQLLSHDASLRRLARSLLGRDDDAEDAVQETYRIALDEHHQVESNFGSWIRTVLRNVVRAGRRSERRRQARERRDPSNGLAEDTVHVVHRMQVHRRLVEHLLGIEEPWRTALLLRYFEQCSAPELARRTGVSVETARTRLKRGRNLLRERIGSEIDARDLAGYLVPASVGGGVSIPTSLPSVFAGWGPIALPVATAVLVVAMVVSEVAGKPKNSSALGTSSEGSLSLSLAVPKPAVVGLRDPSVSSPMRRRVPEPSARPPTPASTSSLAIATGSGGTAQDEEPEPGTIAGVTLGADDQPIGGAFVELWTRDIRGSARLEASCRSDAAGAFRFVPERRFGLTESARVIARSPTGAVASERASVETRIRFPQTTEFVARIVDDQGDPIEGATLSCQGWNLTGSAGLLLPDDLREEFTARSDQDGGVFLSHLPVGASVSFELSAEGHCTLTLGSAMDSREVTEGGVLELPRAAGVHGKVLGVDGGAVPGARVHISSRADDRRWTSTGLTDDRGSYTLGGLGVGECDLHVDLPAELVDRFTTQFLQGLVLEPGNVLEAPDIVLAPGAVLTITVRDRTNHEGIEGVNVSVVCGDRPNKVPVPRRFTDSAGELRARAPAGEVMVFVKADGYIEDPAGRWQHRTVDEGATERFDFELEREPDSLPVHGVIVDEHDVPIPDLPVILVDRHLEERLALVATSDPDGRFEFLFPPKSGGRPIHLRVLSSLWGVAEPLAIAPEEKDPVRLVVQRLPRTALTARILWPDGTPATNVQVDVHEVGPGQEMGLGSPWVGASLRTDASGRIHYTGLWPGHEYRVDAIASLDPDVAKMRLARSVSPVKVAREGEDLDLGDCVLEEWHYR